MEKLTNQIIADIVKVSNSFFLTFIVHQPAGMDWRNFAIIILRITQFTSILIPVVVIFKANGKWPESINQSKWYKANYFSIAMLPIYTQS